ncbi:uncharacterized protein N7482_003068 [Penicillium canariense]|uniref:Uncharacterized protein n=1 Tax=Penicillium canariense TaxID=189055 RepID=A0A9W9IMV3_9EURO|nr:uncharacterized protein N7482_003068 [Penicillium canariense]KAJ5177191.1 hypothetical protein N7482_003068 [Penicillium canariense]
MDNLSPMMIILLAFSLATASPHETAVDRPAPLTTVVTAESPRITEEGTLRCSGGATVLHTTDCTMGTSVSFCYKPPPPLHCDEGYFPSVWHPDHCMEESTCFPTDAEWITRGCSNGAYPYSTKTVYDGTLAGGHHTVISSISCACPPDQWYSISMREGASRFETYCMPSRSCPPGMTTSISTNDYCATASAAICSHVPAQADHCECEGKYSTPVYAEGPSATATGCG